MSNRELRKTAASIIVLLMVVFCLSAVASANVSAGAVTGNNAAIAASYGKLPIAFEANDGQTDPNVKYFARGQGYTLFLTPQEFVLSMATPKRSKGVLTMSSIRIRFINPNPDAETITGIDNLPGKSNYFIGTDPQKWRTNVPAYEKVKYTGVYRGVDLVVYGNQKKIEYDFVVAPHADYKQIALRVEGAKTLRPDRDGNLIIAARGGKMLMHKPLVYQEIDGVKKEIKGRYQVGKGNLVSFNVSGYDRNKELVIDPTLAYSTYLGGSNGTYGDMGNSIAVDSSGNAYIAGITYSTDFPATTGAYQTAWKGTDKAFITKLNSTGTALVYSTLLGGSNADSGAGIAVDSSGNAYVTGSTLSADFPTTNGAYQTSLKGNYNVFITKLNATGTALVYSTLLGGSTGDSGNAIAIDSSGSAYVTGSATSSDFPTTTGAFQTAVLYYDVFITKLNTTGTALVYSTLLGGRDRDFSYSIAVDSSGNAYVTGLTWSTDFPVTTGAFQTTLKGSKSSGYVTKLNSGGTALVYSTFLGGSNGGYGRSIAVDPSGYAYVAGTAFSTTDFPVTTGAFQTTIKGFSNAYVTKLNVGGTALVYSTLLGGTGEDEGIGIAIDSTGNAYVTGYTTSSDFPTTTGAFQTTLKGASNAYITKLNAGGTALVYSTLLGGSNSSHGDTGNGIALDSSGNAYVAGYTNSTDFPVTTGAFQTTLKGFYNVFAAKLQLSSPSSYTLSVTKTGNGTITSSPSGISCGSTCSSSYTSGTSVTLTAAASSGYSFSSWSGCDNASGTQCTVTLVSNKSVTATFTSSGASDNSTIASSAFNAIYNEYASWFGSTSGSIQTGTSWISYYQLYTNGAYLVAGTDGILYVYYIAQLTSLGITWQPLGKAAIEITAVYNQYASWFGTKSGSIYIGTSGSAAYYVQWYSNGAALVAGTDGSMYTYYNGTWYALGVSWR
ncbi:MAG: SBBP repeat-containing protein [Nitrospirae bacterium]|nr:SBBP repeat-containing protein [Nitrospirota bacterium]